LTSKRTIAVAALLAIATPAAAQVDPTEPPSDPTGATNVEPELAIGLRAVTSINGARDDAGATSNALDFSDTYMFLRPRVHLYQAGLRAGALFGITFPDVYDQPGTLFLADAHAFVDHRWGTVRIGRGRIKSRLLAFPTLRDDDMIRYSDAQNPFSEGKSTADLQFGNTLDVSVWPAPRWYAELHAENLASSVLSPADERAFRLNSLGLAAGYRQIPADAPLSIVRQIAVGANTYHIDLPGQRWTSDVMAGAWLGLLVDPIHSIDLRGQVTYSLGIDGAMPDTQAGAAQSRAVFGIVSLGYTYRRRLLPTLRSAILVGARRYTRADRDQSSVAANIFYSLGATVEVGLQYQYQQRDAGLPNAFGDAQQHSIKLALVATFETVLGRLFDERDSVLNVNSRYLP
jgi:hypothetical protein